MANILVVISAPDATLARSGRELLTLAASLGTPEVALTGPAEPALVETLAGYGVERVYHPQDASVLAQHLVAPAAAFLAEIAGQTSPAAVLLANTAESREIAARLGIKLGSGVITDAVAIAQDFLVTKSVLAGAYSTQCRVTTGVPIITVKPNSVVPAAPDTGAARTAETVAVPVPESGPAARITGRTDRPASGRPPLGEARVVVAGGRGTNGDFSAVEALADALGGAVGASRAATDAGWIGHNFQVGQTGHTVSPQLYVSAGISGAIQQKAGMQTSQVIVAVNKDAESPVFEIADFGVIGDLFKVLPQATEEIRRRKG